VRARLGESLEAEAVNIVQLHRCVLEQRCPWQRSATMCRTVRSARCRSARHLFADGLRALL